jgi:hypothetical protein
MLSIFSHQGYANQNYIGIPSHPYQNGYNQENKQQMLAKEPSYTAGRNVNWCNHYENQCESSSKTKSRTTI